MIWIDSKLGFKLLGMRFGTACMRGVNKDSGMVRQGLHERNASQGFNHVIFTLRETNSVLQRFERTSTRLCLFIHAMYGRTPEQDSPDYACASGPTSLQGREEKLGACNNVMVSLSLLSSSMLFALLSPLVLSFSSVLFSRPSYTQPSSVNTCAAAFIWRVVAVSWVYPSIDKEQKKKDVRSS